MSKSANLRISSSSTKRRRRILVAVKWSSYAMLEGLARYAKEAGWWLDLGLAGHGMQIPERWDGDGIIGLIGRSAELRKLIEVSALPTVLLSMDPADLACPRVATDHDAIVTEAVAHFEAQRFIRYIVFDVMDSPTQLSRNKKFVEQVRARGHECLVFKPKHAIADGVVPVSVVNEMAEFLRSQSKPVAVFCAQDDFAQFVLVAAAQAGAKVPDEIAVLGVNNDHLLCDFSEPTLSSVDTRQSELGYRGAETLDKLMNGEAVPPMTKIAPLGVVARRSTEIWATDDLLARSALNFIWSSYRSGLQVSDVAKEAGGLQGGPKQQVSTRIQYQRERRDQSPAY